MLFQMTSCMAIRCGANVGASCDAVICTSFFFIGDAAVANGMLFTGVAAVANFIGEAAVTSDTFFIGDAAVAIALRFVCEVAVLSEFGAVDIADELLAGVMMKIWIPCSSPE